MLGSEQDTAGDASDETFISRECARRTFWCIHIVEVLGALFTGRAISYNREDLVGYQLPCDETTFEMQRSTRNSEMLRPSDEIVSLLFRTDEVESIDSIPPKSVHVSELGQVIRISMILLDIQRCSTEGGLIIIIVFYDYSANSVCALVPTNLQEIRVCQSNLEVRSSALRLHLSSLLITFHCTTLFAIFNIHGKPMTECKKFHINRLRCAIFFILADLEIKPCRSLEIFLRKFNLACVDVGCPVKYNSLLLQLNAYPMRRGDHNFKQCECIGPCFEPLSHQLL